MVCSEFQAIVLAAGRGTRLPELTGNYPKCLLPIGPYPLIFYPLHLLETHNFQDAIVIALESHKSDIQQALEKTPLKLKIEFVCIPNDSDYGTADSIRHIHDKIKTDFLVISCDVVTNISLYPLINKFRQHDASVAALLFSSCLDTSIPVPGPKNKYKPERDLIGVHPDSKRLLFLASTSDFEENFTISGHLMRKNSIVTLHSRLVDGHIYVIKKWLIDFLKKKDNFSTFKGEFLPYIVKKQMSKIQTSSTAEQQSEIGYNLRSGEDIFEYAPHTKLDEKILKASLFNDSQIKEPYSGDIIRCYAIEAPKTDFGVRINTTAAYFAINQKISFLWPELIGFNNNCSLISPSAVVNSTQTKEISVADDAKLSEKTSLTNSTFGSNTFISPKVRVSNSIIMSNVTVEEGCIIENTIICYRATIKKGSILKNCLVGPNYVVEENTEKQQAHLTNADGFMEIE